MIIYRYREANPERKEVRTMMTIKNLPADANEYKYIIARLFDDEYWYYSATNDELLADAIAHDCYGRVFHN